MDFWFGFFVGVGFYIFISYLLTLQEEAKKRRND